MVDLGISVFENYTLKDVLGEVPPFNSKLREKLEYEVSSLIKNLDKKSQPELEETLLQYIKAKKEMTKFSGAMALDQSKIEMFHEFVSKYISEIKSRLKN